MIGADKSQKALLDLVGNSGWHLEKGVLEPDKVVALREFLEERRKRLQEQFESWASVKLNTAEDYGRCQAQIPEYESRGLPKDFRHFLTGELDLETRLDTRIVELLGARRCRDFLCESLGVERFYIHYPPMIRFKVAESPGSVLPPHQDAPYSSHLREFLTVWVPLVDIDSEVGGLIMYNGSHRAGILDHRASGPWAFGTEDGISRFETEHVFMAAGDALLFPSSTIHASAPQKSRTRLRFSIDFRVFRNATDTTKSYFDPFENKITRQH